jgi:hypothetical protein
MRMQRGEGESGHAVDGGRAGVVSGPSLRMRTCYDEAFNRAPS